MDFQIPQLSLAFYLSAMPVLVLCFGALMAMMQAVIPSISSPRAVMGAQFVFLVIALGSAVGVQADQGADFLDGALLAGELGQFGQVFILIVGIVVAALFSDSFLKDKFFRGEISCLYLMSLAGMLVLVASDDLITMFVGIELSSIALYALVGYVNPSRRSQEGAIKYFVLGAFAAGLLLFGFGLLYAGTGTMRVSEIIERLPMLADHNWVKIGALFTMIGFSFKLALAPFHLWAPDAYEAAPTGITALMATTVKVMVLIVVARLFVGGFNHLYDVWTPGLMFIAIMSMVFGNIMALVQSSLKRMLAYSSIAHSGYLAVAICAIGGTEGSVPVAAILFYVTGYTLASLGAFAVIMWLENDKNDAIILDDLSGLASKHPWAAFAMAVFMFAFAGMPPTVGFLGKFFVFNAALKSELYSLVIIGVIGSTISLYYYLRVIVRMYMTPENESGSVSFAPTRAKISLAVIGAALVLTILLGTVLPGKAMQFMDRTASEVSAH